MIYLEPRSLPAWGRGQGFTAQGKRVEPGRRIAASEELRLGSYFALVCSAL